MSDISSIFTEMTAGLSLKRARQDWDRTVERFMSHWGSERAPQVWKKKAEEFLETVEAEAAETILEALLFLMQTRFKIDPFIPGSEFRRNIDNFTAFYRFSGMKSDFKVEVKFQDGTMRIPSATPPFLGRVWERVTSCIRREPQASGQEPTSTVEFKDARGLIRLLISYGMLNERNFLQSITNNDIRVQGNLNYLYKFIFMVNHMLLEATGKLPQ